MNDDRPSNLPARVIANHQLAEPVPFGVAARDPAGSAGPTTDWRRLRSAMWRFKWLLMTVPVAMAAAGYGVSRFIRPVYVASGTVWINKQADAAALRAAQGSQFGSGAWVDLFRSYRVIDRVVTQYRLTLNILGPVDTALVASYAGLDPTFTPGNFTVQVDASGKTYTVTNNKGVVVEQQPVGGPVGKSLGLRWTPPATSLTPGREINIQVLSPRQAATDLLDRLNANIDQTGTFLHAELSGLSPARTAAILNSIIEQFVEVAAHLKSEGLSERTRILGEQLRAAQRDLTAAETALEKFRRESLTVPRARAPGGAAQAGADPSADRVALYRATQRAMDSTLAERTAIRRVLADAADSGIVVSRLERLPSVMASSELSGALRDLTAKRDSVRALQQRYTDSHPLVVKARAEAAFLERTLIPEAAGRVIADLSAREADLSRRLSTTDQALRAEPALANTEARLQRAVTLAEGLYSQLQPRFEEAQLAEGSTIPDVRPLDPAEPPQFSDSVDTKRLVLVAFLGGLGLACAAALTLDRMDPKFRYPDQISREFGIPILGAVPHMTAKGKSGARAEENGAFQEAIRDVRMNVEYAYGGVGPVIFTVSSPGPSDGKSFVAANLARSFAESGRRTLLIDADLRRGELHRRCGVGRRPGLTDCLRGTASLDAIVRPTDFSHLDLITSGTRHRDAPELLGSAAAAKLFGDLRARYDAIVCDSPPLSAGIDPFVLTALSGNILLVVRTGVSVREVIESKLKVLARMPVRILGAVLNDVPRNSTYGYYASYVPGYDAVDETGTAVQAVIG